MKKFDELSERITEEEYRNNGRFHYSDIAGYMRNGFSYIIDRKEEESESLSFGSIVDCIVTQGMDEFNRKYCVERDFGLSENQKLVTMELTKSDCEYISDILPQAILEVLEEVGLYKNYKDETKVAKIISECGDYYSFLVENEGKIPVDREMFDDAVDVANRILSSESVGMFFTGKEDNVDKFSQLKFNGEIDGIPVTCMVDSLYIDHETKQVWPIDLKTTCAGYEWDFPKSFVKWRYDCQAKLYSTILRQVMDSDPDYKDYMLMGFVFVYVSRKNKTPIIWTFDKCIDSDDLTIERKNGTKLILEDFRKYLKEMNEIKENDLKIPIGIDGNEGNDIIEHLKEF